MTFNYVTIGYDCSPAAALRGLHLREFALPFDWVESNINVLQMCFETKFKDFHKNVTFNYNKKRLIDHYGFQFPHDYPLTNMTNFENNIGEGVFGGRKGGRKTNKHMFKYIRKLNKTYKLRKRK